MSQMLGRHFVLSHAVMNRNIAAMTLIMTVTA
jgi:hypothetical protein